MPSLGRKCPQIDYMKFQRHEVDQHKNQLLVLIFKTKALVSFFLKIELVVFHQGCVVFCQHFPCLRCHESIRGVFTFPSQLSHACPRNEVKFVVPIKKNTAIDEDDTNVIQYFIRRNYLEMELLCSLKNNKSCSWRNI